MNIYACQCKGPLEERRRHWRVVQRRCHHSAFSGYHYTPSDYSSVRCERCERHWRTKAAYVSALEDNPRG